MYQVWKKRLITVLAGIALIASISMLTVYIDRTFIGKSNETKSEDGKSIHEHSRSMSKRILDRIKTQVNNQKSSIDKKSTMQAEDLCMKFPDENICQSWKEQNECDEYSDCEEEDFAILDSDVVKCFVSPLDRLDSQDIQWISSECYYDDIMIKSPEEDRQVLDYTVTDMPKGAQQWANTITPDHISGVASGTLLILDKFNMLKILAPDDIVETFQIIANANIEKKADNEKARGITIGLFNTALSTLDKYSKVVQERNYAKCDLYDEEKLIPAYCHADYQHQ